MKPLKFKNFQMLLIIMALMLIGSCNKNYEPKVDNQENNLELRSINEINFSDDFDWKTSQNIEFTITGSEKQVITISSIDMEVRYHRGYFMGDGDYRITLNIPKTVKSVKVNNLTVSLSSRHITCNLDQ